MQRNATDSDPVYWSWSFEGWNDTTPENEALRDAVLQGLADGIVDMGPQNLVDMEADLVEIFEASGGPAVFVDSIDPPLAIGTGTASPHVIQCAVNELVDTARGTAVRGRMFVGPLANSPGAVIPNTHKDGAVAIMQNVAQAADAIGCTLTVISKYLAGAERANPIGFPVTGFRADNRIDILKTRRIEDSTPPEDYPLFPAA